MNRRLKILHTMTWLAPGGGVDENVRLSVRELADEFDIDVAVGNEVHRNPFNGNAGVRLLICPYLFRAIRPWEDLKSLWWFYRLIRREGYDIVHTHEAKASLISRLAARLAGCPMIIYGIHGVTFNDPSSVVRRSLLIAIEKWTTPAAHKLISVSRSVLEHYAAAGIGRGIQQEIVYSGIDVPRFLAGAKEARLRRAELRRGFGWDNDDEVLVSVGRFSHAKAQRLSIEAFAKLKENRPRIKLLLIGEGELQAACRQQAARLGVAQDVRFHGFSEQVEKLLPLADLFLFTSLREGLPRGIVEGYLCGIPAVSFEVEGVREIIEHGVNGYVVPSGDVAALAAVAGDFLDHPERLEKFAECGRRKASEQWDHRKMASSLRRIYSGLPAAPREAGAVARFFDGYAGDFDGIYGHTGPRGLLGRAVDQVLRRTMFLRFAEVLRETSKPEISSVLDIGCGPGRYCEEFAKQGKRVVGIDIAGCMLELARRRTGESERLQYVVSDFMSYTPHERFDAACLMGFFDYVERPLDVLLKLKLDVSREIYASFPKSGGILAWQRLVRYRLRGCPLYLYSHNQLIKLLHDAGWEGRYQIRDFGRDYFVKISLAPVIEPRLEHQHGPERMLPVSPPGEMLDPPLTDQPRLE